VAPNQRSRSPPFAQLCPAPKLASSHGVGDGVQLEPRHAPIWRIFIAQVLFTSTVAKVDRSRPKSLYLTPFSVATQDPRQCETMGTKDQKHVGAQLKQG